MKKFWRGLKELWREYLDRLDANREEWRMFQGSFIKPLEEAEFTVHKRKVRRGCTHCGRVVSCEMGYHCQGRVCTYQCTWCNPKIKKRATRS
jgi:hypothetical protein